MQATRFTIRPLIIRTKSEFFPHGTNNNEFISASHNKKQNVEIQLRYIQIKTKIKLDSKLNTFNWTNPGRVHISEWANTKKYVPTVLIYTLPRIDKVLIMKYVGTVTQSYLPWSHCYILTIAFQWCHIINMAFSVQGRN